MGLFSSTPKVPNTISDQRLADLSRRAQKAEQRSMFDPEVVRRRLASHAQQRKAKHS
jgi:hypothetical protein